MKIALLLLAIAAVGLLALIAAVVQPVPGSGPRWGGPAADPDRLARLVSGLVGLGPRHDAAGQWKAADFLRAQLGGFAVEEQRYTVAGAGFRNLIIRLGPDTQERLVIGAHYDAHGPYPGADDNASGTAALIEIARLLQGATLPLRTELAWYSNEEYGLLGSEAHARSVRGVRAMVSLEMLGCFDQPQRFPFAPLRLFYPSHGDYIVVVGRFRDIPVVGSIKSALNANGAAARSINATAMVPGIDASDHASFWGRGVKAAMVTDTAWYRNPRYHTALDMPDTLDYARMARIVEGMAAWASAVPR